MSHRSRKGPPRWLSSKESACQCRRHRDTGTTSGSGRSPGKGNGNPLQCSCLENSMDTGVWWAAVYGVTKSWTQLSRYTHTHTHTHTHTWVKETKNGSSSQETLGEAKSRFLLEPPEETSPTDTLTSVPSSSHLTSDLQNCRDSICV